MSRNSTETNDCIRIREFLELGHYEQAAELLREIWNADALGDNQILADTVAAAHQICLAALQCRAEVTWHRRAGAEADQREQEFRRQLCALLDLLDGHAWEAMETDGDPTPPLARDAPELGMRPGLWQRVRRLFGADVGSKSPARVATTASPDATIPPSGSRAQELSARSVTQAQALAAAENVTTALPAIPHDVPGKRGAPSLVVYCLGPFRVYQDDKPVEEWPSSKGKCIFKYLVAYRERPVAKEVLMELFWPGAHPDAARNNLNVAVYGLRQALRQARPSYSHVLFQDDCYLFNPELHLWVDYEAFGKHLTTARTLEQRSEKAAATRAYHAAEVLYQGDFLMEDRYEDWLLPQRQSLQDDYLYLLERLGRYYFDRNDYIACMTVCNKMLAVDACCEKAHRRLMRCYSRQGQPYLALRQYHLCVEKLKADLDAQPAPDTLALYDKVHQGERI